ncbi:MAG: nicotinate-nucleotide--dimethylbenzimidazole phosphoribosyltransferase, partial [Pseudoflavonifractor sp.]
DGVDVLWKVGGLDLAGLAGVFLGGAACRLPVLVDGFISAAAALVAAALCPEAKDYMLGSHASGEPAGKMVLDALGLTPFLYAGMCLGEGTGAVAVLPLLDMGLCVYGEMASFEEIKVEAYQPLK